MISTGVVAGYNHNTLSHISLVCDQVRHAQDHQRHASHAGTWEANGLSPHQQLERGVNGPRQNALSTPNAPQSNRAPCICLVYTPYLLCIILIILILSFVLP